MWNQSMKKHKYWLRHICNTYILRVFLILVCVPFFVGATAAETTTATAEVKSAVDGAMVGLKPWILCLAVALLFWGAVQTALAYRSEDAMSKLVGIRILVTGASLFTLPNLILLIGAAFMATDGGTKLFNDLTDFLVVAASMFGVCATFFGTVFMAMGYRNEDAPSKLKGLRMVIIGCACMSSRPIFELAWRFFG